MTYVYWFILYFEHEKNLRIPVILFLASFNALDPHFYFEIVVVDLAYQIHVLIKKRVLCDVF